MATQSEDRKQLLAELQRDLQYYSDNTRSQYISHAINYLFFVGKGDWKDKEVLYSYVSKLQKQGLAQRYINYIIRGPVGALFRMRGLRLPVRLPRVAPAVYGANEAMFFTVAEIEKLIQTAKKGTAQEQAVLAISTTYGPRVAEIQRIKSENIIHEKDVIVIHTVKWNLKREHLIPKEISKVLLGYDYPTVSRDTMYDLLYKLIERAGIERKPKQAYHAIRHTLAEELGYRGCTDQEVYDFTGWLKGGTLGSYVRPLRLNVENDHKCLSKIPWLEVW